MFAHHADVIAALARHLGEYSPAVLTGATTSREREDAVDKFLKDPRCRVFIGNIQAAGTAITLVGPKCKCSDVVFVESSWTPMDNAQAACRVHRIGQKDGVVARMLSAAGHRRRPDQRAAGAEGPRVHPTVRHRRRNDVIDNEDALPITIKVTDGADQGLLRPLQPRQPFADRRLRIQADLHPGGGPDVHPHQDHRRSRQVADRHAPRSNRRRQVKITFEGETLDDIFNQMENALDCFRGQA